MKITNQKHGTLTEADLLELAKLLVKAGYYGVHKGRERENGKQSGKYVHYVEYEEAR